MKNTIDSPTPEEVLALVIAAKTGDSAAFEQLYQHFYQPILRYLVIRVGDMDDAEDLAQKTFIKFYRNLHNWQDQGYSPAAYLYTVARSVLADHFRSQKARKLDNSEDILGLLADRSQNLEKSVIESEEVQQIFAAMHKLPELDAEVLRLRFIEGLSNPEIASIIDKSDVATRKTLSRATQRLKSIIEQEPK